MSKNTEFAIALRHGRWIEPHETAAGGGPKAYPTLVAARKELKAWAEVWLLDAEEEQMDLVVVALPFPRSGFAYDADIRIEAEELRAEILTGEEVRQLEGEHEARCESYYGGDESAEVYARNERKAGGL